MPNFEERRKLNGGADHFEDDTQQRRRSSDDVEVRMPFGSFRAQGKNAGVMLMMCAIIVALVYVFYLYDQRRSATELRVDADHRALSIRLEEMVWLLSLPEKEREKLNIAMPESLRGRINNNNNDYNNNYHQQRR